MIKPRMPYVVAISGLLASCAPQPHDDNLNNPTQAPITANDAETDLRDPIVIGRDETQGRIVWLDEPETINPKRDSEIPRRQVRTYITRPYSLKVYEFSLEMVPFE
jgi:hypothetical protein